MASAEKQSKIVTIRYDPILYNLRFGNSSRRIAANCGSKLANGGFKNKYSNKYNKSKEGHLAKLKKLNEFKIIPNDWHSNKTSELNWTQNSTEIIQILNNYQRIDQMVKNRLSEIGSNYELNTQQVHQQKTQGKAKDDPEVSETGSDTDKALNDSVHDNDGDLDSGNSSSSSLSSKSSFTESPRTLGANPDHRRIKRNSKLESLDQGNSVTPGTTKVEVVEVSLLH